MKGMDPDPDPVYLKDPKLWRSVFVEADRIPGLNPQIQTHNPQIQVKSNERERESTIMCMKGI